LKNLFNLVSEKLRGEFGEKSPKPAGKTLAVIYKEHQFNQLNREKDGCLSYITNNIQMKIFLFSLALILLSSCFSTHEFLIRKNGSASVKIYDWKEVDEEKINGSAVGEEIYSHYDKLESIKIISNYSRSKENDLYTVEYVIENIDSLSKYLFPFSPDSIEVESPVKFRYTKEKFTITQTYDEDIHPNEATMYGELVPFKAIFKFQQRIKKFKSDLDFVKQTGKKSIEVNTNLNEFSYGQGTHTVEVYF